MGVWGNFARRAFLNQTARLIVGLIWRILPLWRRTGWRRGIILNGGGMFLTNPLRRKQDDGPAEKAGPFFISSEKTLQKSPKQIL
jgi:hypothetical protein